MSEHELDIEKIRDQAANRTLGSVLFNLANAYNIAEQKIGEELDQSKNAYLSAPAIMCKSFSIELLLKLFIVYSYPNIKSKDDIDSSGVSLHGHKYSVLYDRINHRLRTEIAKLFTAVLGIETDETKFREKLIEIGDDPFVYWRYVYEKGESKFNSDLAEKILRALGRAAAESVKRDVFDLRT